MSHVGVFRGLEDQGIRPDLIVGCSMGSVLGGVYAYNANVAFLEGFAQRFSENHVATRLERFLMNDHSSTLSRMVSFSFYSLGFANSYWRHGYLSTRLVNRAYRDVVGEGVLGARRFHVEDTTIGFAVLSADMISGDAVIITKGDIPETLFASSAFPGVCKPVHYNDMYLMDGGIVSVVPVLAAHILGADRIIAVNTEPRPVHAAQKNALEAIDKASNIRARRWNDLETDLADIVISPEGISEYKFFEFSKISRCVDAGRIAIEDRMEDIKGLMAEDGDPKKKQRRKELEATYGYRVI